MDSLIVVIVTYNSSHVVEGLLDTLPGALDGLPAEVVVVDNGSEDGTAGLLSGRADCMVIESENLGYAGGINCGIKAMQSSGPILILNPDVRLDPGSVRGMLQSLAEPYTGIVAPKIRNVDGTVFHSLRRRPTLLRAAGFGFTRLPLLSEYVTEESEYEKSGVVDWALGAVLLLSRNCLEELGGWDESYFLYSEETDYCLRAADRGWLTRFCPSASAVHIGGQSGQNDRTHVMQIVNRVRLYSRRNNVIASWVYFFLTALSEATWVLRGHRQSIAAIRALLHPASRPPELGASSLCLPR